MAATVWNSADRDPGLFLFNSDLSVETSFKLVGVAYDITNNKVWVYDSATQQWNNDTLTNQNPATGTGGYTPTGIGAGPYFPMWSSYNSNATADSVTANFGASTMFVQPSGFSTCNSAAGATVTWDSGNKSADITLSDSDLTATKTGANGTFRSVKATHSFSSGKVYFEVTVRGINSTKFQMFGFGNSSAATSTYAGDNTNSFGAYTSAAYMTYLYNSTDSGTRAFATANFYNKAMRATNATASGQKRVFEATVTVSATPVTIGVGNSSASLTQFVGQNANSYSWAIDSTTSAFWTNNSSAAGASVPDGTTIMVAVDTAADKIWFYDPVQAKWNNDVIANQNPVGAVGGFDVSGIGKILYPMVGSSNVTGPRAVVVANFAGPFSNSIPAGFSVWDAAVVDGVGAASGTGAASGVGAGVASSAGAATGTGAGAGVGIGTGIILAAGAAAGTATATGVSTSAAASVGSALGSGVAAGLSVPTTGGDGLAYGAGVATGVASDVQGGAGTSAGVGAAAAIGSDAGTSVGSAAGVGDAQGSGSTLGYGIGSSAAAGTSSASATSLTYSLAAGYSESIAHVYGVGTGIIPAAGAVSLQGAAVGVGAPRTAGVGAAAGTGAAAGVGRGASPAAGAAAGTGAATGVGGKTLGSYGRASGAGAGAAVGVQVPEGVGVASGVGAVAAVGRSTFAGVGASSATGSAAGVGRTFTSGVGAATGTGVVAGAMTAVQLAAAVSSAVATAMAVGSFTAISPLVSTRTVSAREDTRVQTLLPDDEWETPVV